MNAPVKTWTLDEIRGLGVRTDLPTAFAIVVGGGKWAAWKAYHEDRLPFPVLRVGRKVAVPTAPLIRLLGLTDADHSNTPSEAA